MKKYAVTFILLLLFFLAANMPATLLAPYAKNIDNFQVDSINGTVWKGSMSSNRFEKLQWDVNPLYLLIGSISADIDVKINNSNNLRATANIGLLNTAQLDKVSAELTTSYLQQLNPNYPMFVQAEIVIYDAKVTFDDFSDGASLIYAAGSANIEKANLLGEDLGGYDAEFKYEDNMLSSRINSNSSSKVVADINLILDPKLKLTLEGRLKPKTVNLEQIFKELNITNQYSRAFQL